MSKILIPQRFINIAKSYGIDGDIATQYFLVKRNKKNTNSVAWELARRQDEGIGESRRRLTEAWNMYNSDNSIEEVVVDRNDKTYIDKSRASLENLVGKFKYPNPPKLRSKKIVVISDLHNPFIREDVLNQVLHEEADQLWILGDILDCYAASRHRPTLSHIIVKEELAIARAQLEAFSARFNKVNLITGNHERKVIKRVQEQFPAILPFLQDPLEIICYGLSNVTIHNIEVAGTADATKYGENVKLPYVAVQGDILFSHLENFCGDAALDQIEDWLTKWSKHLKLDPRVILHAHTHRLGMKFSPTGKVLVSTGSMCKPMPYTFENHGKYSCPITGYVTLEQHNGVTDFDSIRLVYVD